MTDTIGGVLAVIEHVASHSTDTPEEAAVINGRTHRDSIAAILTLARKGLEIDANGITAALIETPSLATLNPAPTSSVTLTQGAKRETRCEVKVYAADVTEAARLAVEQYDALVARYSPAQGEPT